MAKGAVCCLDVMMQTLVILGITVNYFWCKLLTLLTVNALLDLHCHCRFIDMQIPCVDKPALSLITSNLKPTTHSV